MTDETDPCRRLRRLLADGEPGAAVDPHLADCPACRRFQTQVTRVEAALSDLAEEAPVDAPSFPLREAAPVRRLLPAAVGIAAAGLAAIWLVQFLLAPGRPAARRSLPAGERIAGRDESFDGDSAAGRTVELPDGSRFRIAPETAVRFAPPGPGERIFLELARGEVEADIPSGGGAVVIGAPAGRLRVLGTVFRATAFRVHPAGRPPVDFLGAEVAEGTVRLENERGSLRVPAGRRGILRRDGIARLQEMPPMDPATAVERFGADARSPGFAESFACATLLTGRWEGFRGWEGVVADSRAPAKIRSTAALLTGLTAGSADAPRLRALYDREPEGSVREALLPHLARLLEGSEAAALLETAVRDPDARIRRLAARLSEECR